MRPAALLVLTAALAHSACIAVPGDRILARDLAAAVPLFQAVAPDQVIGFAPFPGVTQVLTSRDILLAARRYGLQTPSGEALPSVCVERVLHPLLPDELRAALLAALRCGALPCDVAHLEILEFSNQPFPPGRLFFQLSALNRPPAGNPESPVIWPGQLVYDAQRSLRVWAKVRIAVNREILVAAETIPKRSVIRAGQVSTARVPMFPLPEPLPLLPPAVIGKWARREIRAGQRIVAEALEDPKDVVRGETVRVTVVDGAATITLDAVAGSSGNKGDSVLIHNPSTGKTFQAQVEDRKRVVVNATPESIL